MQFECCSCGLIYIVQSFIYYRLNNQLPNQPVDNAGKTVHQPMPDSEYAYLENKMPNQIEN